MTTHRTVLLALAASIAAVGTTASTAAAATNCKSVSTLQTNITVTGGAKCGTARAIADIFWQGEQAAAAAKRGELVTVKDDASGITAESFKARGWTCIRSVKITLGEENSEYVQGTAKCSKGKQIVRWQIVDVSAPAGE